MGDHVCYGLVAATTDLLQSERSLSLQGAEGRLQNLVVDKGARYVAAGDRVVYLNGVLRINGYAVVVELADGVVVEQHVDQLRRSRNGLRGKGLGNQSGQLVILVVAGLAELTYPCVGNCGDFLVLCSQLCRGILDSIRPVNHTARLVHNSTEFSVHVLSSFPK